MYGYDFFGPMIFSRPVFGGPGVGEGGGGNPPSPPPPPAPGGNNQPATAPWSAAQGVWQVGEGALAQPWYNTITDQEVREHVAAKQYANPGELAKANLNLTRLQTGDPTVVALPGKDAKPEAWDSFWKRLGRPDSADKYEFKFGEGVKPDDNMVKFGKTFFHKLGLSNERANAAIGDWNTFVAEQTAAQTAKDKTANDTEIAALETKWNGTGELNKNKEAGLRVIKALKLSDELVSRVENSIGTAAVVEMLATIGRKSDEGGFLSGQGGGDPNIPENMTKEQASARIAQLRGDVTFLAKYNDGKHPEHAEAVKLMERLYSRGGE